ncbi:MULTISPECIES: pur operon repressor [Salimicrobium]|uniref:Pur operon repressor n=4 Tax=Salimicrobium TaxID=351195 RepID=K2H534_9BACI|nr:MULTISPECIES: pur operon repressor [Salimicrobium]AKG03267.1 pur operon repressor [Salimicrobium jeotgali]EKE30985.1 pur operon repressor [Salimicrobium jeotgali]MBM7697504.1 purine operon repressor [Salimicrobium jeotgali]PBB04915.1 pur operon repressor [Salimicrobium humidisoli]SDY35977.1 purine operon repressor, PurR [Salimicrobium album]
MKRSKRLVSMTRYIIEHPYTLISLPFFVEKFGSAKSSISEDLGIIDERFQEEGTGYLASVAGASGGVKYIPAYSQSYGTPFVEQLCEKLSDTGRLLPGGYLFMSDLLGDPRTVNDIGKMFASVFVDREIDAVMTVATKGIPLAYAVAAHLNVPVVIARRDPKVTEGSTVSINYVSGSTRKIQTMVLTKRSLSPGSNVCIIDDFMKAGGTINGMKNLLKEFDAQVAGIGVLAEAEDEEEERVVDDYVSLLRILHADDRTKEIEVEAGNLLGRL